MLKHFKIENIQENFDNVVHTKHNIKLNQVEMDKIVIRDLIHERKNFFERKMISMKRE